MNSNRSTYKKVNNSGFININNQVPDINQQPKHKQKLALTPQQTQIIFNYFFYNNFQDFNTWQQIAKTKTQYFYQELNNENQLCKAILKWQDIAMPIFIETSEGKNKKQAKKNVIKILITTLVYQGFIGFGFKDLNFIQKLPRRRKQEESDNDQGKGQQEIQAKKNFMKKLLQDHKVDQAFQILTFQNALEFWVYSLENNNITLCEMIIKKLNGGDKYSFDSKKQIEKENQDQHKILRQVTYEKQFMNPFQEDLTDFIRYYQLQWPKFLKTQFKSFLKNDIKLIPKKLFSEESLKNTLIQDKQIIRKNSFCTQVFPLQGIQQYLISSRKRVKPAIENNYLTLGQQFYEPKFQIQQSKSAFPLKVVESMFNKILFFSLDYQFAIKAIKLLSENVKIVDLGKQIQNSTLEGFYYIKKKQQLTLQFVYILSMKAINPIVSVQGMLVIPNNMNLDALYIFNPKEPQQVLQKKINKKNNTNQFQEMFQISVDQYVLLVDKLDPTKKMLGYVKEVNPHIKICTHHSSLCFQVQGQPLPFTLFKLCNSKIFQKLSSSIIQTSKNYIDFVSCQCQLNENDRNNNNNTVCNNFQKVSLVFQPPTFNYFQPIFQYLAQWSTKKYSILVISENVQILHKILQDQGFQCVKIFKKIQQKNILKHKIICASPLHVCCDLIKNLAFQRVLIHQAHRIPQVTSLVSLTKGCTKLVLMGNQYLCRGVVFSPQSKKLKMNVSLFQKVLRHKKQINIIQSIKHSYFGDSSLLEWANSSFYQNKLRLQNQFKTPIIKGFNWPSNQYRICLIHTQKQDNKFNAFVNHQALLCSWIALQVLKSGFTQINQITCCCIQRSNIQILQLNLVDVLKQSQVQPKLYGKVFQKLVRQIDGSLYYENDLLLLMMGDDQIQQNSYQQLVSILNMAQRGLVIVGDFKKTSQKSKIWANFISWCAQKKLIMKFQQKNKNMS